MMCKFLEQNIKYVVFGLSKNDKSKFSRPWTAMNDTTKTQYVVACIQITSGSSLYVKAKDVLPLHAVASTHHVNGQSRQQYAPSSLSQHQCRSIQPLACICAHQKESYSTKKNSEWLILTTATWEWYQDTVVLPSFASHLPCIYIITITFTCTGEYIHAPVLESKE
jgi:hypothetical protein